MNKPEPTYSNEKNYVFHPQTKFSFKKGDISRQSISNFQILPHKPTVSMNNDYFLQNQLKIHNFTFNEYLRQQNIEKPENDRSSKLTYPEKRNKIISNFKIIYDHCALCG